MIERRPAWPLASSRLPPGTMAAAHRILKEDRWPSRDLDLDGAIAGLEPVLSWV
jgi:hypothetical protein